MTALLRAIDWLAKPAGRSPFAPGVMTRRRVVAAALLISTATSCAAIGAFAAGPERTSAALAAISLGPTLATGVWLRSAESHVGPAIALCFQAWLAIAIGTVVAYGGTGLDSHWNLLVPLLATYVAGPRAGLAFGLLVVAEFGAWTWLVAQGVLVPRALPRTVEIFNGLGTLSVLLALGTSYDRSRSRTEHELGAAVDDQRRLIAAIEAAEDGVVIVGGDRRLLYVNAAAVRITGLTRQQMERRTNARAFARFGAPAFWSALQAHESWRGAFDGKGDASFEVRLSPVHDAGGSVSDIVVIRDLTENRRADRELADVNRRLVHASRQAGRADVAINVLHNVGNALTSMHVTANLLGAIVRTSKVQGVQRAAALLAEHHHDLAAFLVDDERGRRLPLYLEQLARTLEDERRRLSSEVTSLQRNMEHVTLVIAQQQRHASNRTLTERVHLAQLIPLVLELAGARSQDVEVTVEGDAVLSTDRHRLIDVLTNLVKNALEAIAETGRTDGRVGIAILQPSPSLVEIRVADNGMGIAPETMPGIFAHGHSTKTRGHGFGLHDGACAASDLGGALHVHSDGIGQGATFVLQLPVERRGSEGTWTRIAMQAPRPW